MKTKRIFAPLLALALCLSLLPVAALADNEVSTWSDLKGALQSVGDGETVVLSANVTRDDDSSIEFSDGSVTLDLNGYTLSSGESECTLIDLQSEGHLTITDSSGAKTGKIVCQSERECSPFIALSHDSTSLTLEGGAIEGKVGENAGAYEGISIGSGSFLMKGGSIKACYDGVILGDGSFTMTGGSITGNTDEGVHANKSNVFLSGSPVIDGNGGSNLVLAAGKTVTVTGALSETAKLGVTMEEPGVFARGGGEDNYTLASTDATRFYSDDTENTVLYDGTEHCASLKPRATVTTAPAAKENLTWTGEAQELITAGAADTSMQYRLNFGGEWGSAIPKGTDAGSYKVFYRAAADDNHVPGNSGWIDVTIAKADGPAAPTNLVGVAPTTANSSDGKITGVDATMEYSADGAAYTACSGTEIADLTAGTYYVRYQETTTHKAGAAATVEVPAYSAATYAVTVNSGSGSGNYAAGVTVTITASSPAMGKVFDKWTSEDGVTFAIATSATTTFKMPSHNVTVTATYKNATYSVTLNTNGSEINSGNVTSYTYGTGATLPTDVTKDGFTFGGWYANSSFTGSAVTEIAATETGNKTYCAKWNTITYSVSGSFDANGKLVATFTAPKDSLLIAAAYESSGKMADAKSFAVTAAINAGTHPFTDLKTGTGYTYKLMLVNASTYAPLCAARGNTKLTVNNGTGSGEYAAETDVKITANAAPAGQTFYMWTCSDSAIFARQIML